MNSNDVFGRFAYAYWLLLGLCYIYSLVLYISAFKFCSWWMKDSKKEREDLCKAFQLNILFNILNLVVSLIWGYNVLKFGLYGCNGYNEREFDCIKDTPNMIYNVIICIFQIILNYYYITVATRYATLWSYI